MMIRALIFDFDGLIIDTETPDFQSWQECYTTYDQTLTLDAWALAVGSGHLFNPYDHLESLLGRSIDREAVRQQVRTRFRTLLGDPQPLPGVVAYLQQAHALGLRIGLASSSHLRWVGGFLDQLGLRAYFEVICTADDVARTKPEPDLYLAAAQRLGIPAASAVALEDSPNGVRAARAAGMRCVAVPNSVTRLMSLDHADLVLPSLAAMPLSELLATLSA